MSSDETWCPRANLADVYEAQEHIHAVMARQLATDTAVDLFADTVRVVADADAVIGYLVQVPGPNKGKHDESCWRVHAPCLAVILTDLLDNR